MKAELRKDQYVWVTAETIAEALALNYISRKHLVEQEPLPVIFNCAILKDTAEDNEKIKEEFKND